MGSWRESTQSRYATTLGKWESFCVAENINPIYPSIAQVINFFTTLFGEGQSYRAMCNARSALNAVIHLQGHKDLSKHPLVKRFLKGVFNKRPPLMKPQFTWDPEVLLCHLIHLGDNDLLTLRDLQVGGTIHAA